MSDQEKSMEHRRSDSGIAVKLDLLHDDVNGIKAVLKELTAAISRLAVVESDQGHIRATQERAFSFLEKLESRVATLEQLAVSSRQANSWVEKALWAVAAASAMYIGKKVGLIT